MNASTTRRLLSLHRWCGLLVSANLLLLALTGLILIFHDEIDAALGVLPKARAGTASTTLASALSLANATSPSAKPVFLFQDQDEHPGLVFVGLSRGARRLDEAKPVAVDLRAGRVFKDLNLEGSFTGIVLELHAELFAGPVGRLLVGLVGLAFLISLISGAIVYGPTMKRFSFGLWRRDKSRRTLFADLHKLVGAASLGWTFVVAGTGLMLSLASVLLRLYSVTELATLGAPYAHEPIVTDLGRIDQAVQQAERGAAGRRWSIVALPGSDLSSPRHYTVLLQGGTGIESRVLTMALVDAKDPTHLEAHQLPFYLRALLLSEPLHFGDYGGLPLKLVWSLFSLVTIVLSVSGVCAFWIARRERTMSSSGSPKSPPRSLAELAQESP